MGHFVDIAFVSSATTSTLTKFERSIFCWFNKHSCANNSISFVRKWIENVSDTDITYKFTIHMQWMPTFGETKTTFFWYAGMKQSMDYVPKERIECTHCRIRKIANIKRQNTLSAARSNVVNIRQEASQKYWLYFQRHIMHSSLGLANSDLWSCTLIYLSQCTHNSLRKFHFSRLSNRHQQYDCGSRAHSIASQLFFFPKNTIDLYCNRCKCTNTATYLGPHNSTGSTVLIVINRKKRLHFFFPISSRNAHDLVSLAVCGQLKSECIFLVALRLSHSIDCLPSEHTINLIVCLHTLLIALQGAYDVNACRPVVSFLLFHWRTDDKMSVCQHASHVSITCRPRQRTAEQLNAFERTPFDWPLCGRQADVLYLLRVWFCFFFFAAIYYTVQLHRSKQYFHFLF